MGTLTVGCQRHRVPADELVVLIEQPPRSIDPRSTATSYDLKLSSLAYGRLISVDDPELSPRPDLAQRVDEVLPREESGRIRYDITLREARFSDGSPVTPEDVAYTFAGVVDKKTGNGVLRSRFEDSGLVLPLEVRGPRTLRLTYAHHHASALTDLDFGIVKRGTFESGPLIGAGPFVLSGPVGEVTRFTRNPYYYGGPPPMRTLTVRVVRDANARLLSLVGGSADLTQNTVSPLLYDAVDRWSRPPNDRLRMQTGHSAIFFYLGLNNEDTHLKDPRVRQALLLGIDRERIVHTKLRGTAVLATAMLPTFHWAYDADVPGYAHDPARAKALLDAAGYPDPDGDGPLPRFTLTYKTSTDALPVSIARVVAAQLAEIGVAVEVRPYEFHLFLDDVKKGNFQIYGLSTGEVAEPNLMKRYFHSHFIPTAADPNAGHNRMRYRNPAMDVLLDAGEREMDREKRRQIYSQVQKILAQDLPILPMWHIDNVVVMRREVQHYIVWPSAQFSSMAQVSKVP